MRWAPSEPRSLIPPWTDVAMATGFVALMAVEVATVIGWGAGGWLVAAVAALAVRRRWPTLVALVVLLVVVLSDPSGNTTGVLATAVATYTVGNCLPPRRAVESICLVGGLAWVAGLVAHHHLSPSDVAAMFVFWVGPFLVGAGHRRATERVAEARALAARADERRVIEAEQAVAEERARIARELHDVVSHSLTVVTINAQAVRRSLPASSDREIEALHAIETTAREATAEMRRLFGVLRAPGGAEPLSPQPGLAQLAGLADRMAEAGVAVTLDVDADVAPSSGLGVTVYRIVQEALTNVLRHAHAERAWVRVVRRGGDHPLGRGDPVEGGHPDVHQHHVGTQP